MLCKFPMGIYAHKQACMRSEEAGWLNMVSMVTWRAVCCMKMWSHGHFYQHQEHGDVFFDIKMSAEGLILAIKVGER